MRRFWPRCATFSAPDYRCSAPPFPLSYPVCNRGFLRSQTSFPLQARGYSAFAMSGHGDLNNAHAARQAAELSVADTYNGVSLAIKPDSQHHQNRCGLHSESAGMKHYSLNLADLTRLDNEKRWLRVLRVLRVLRMLRALRALRALRTFRKTS